MFLTCLCFPSDGHERQPSSELVFGAQRCVVAGDAPRGHFVTHFSATEEDVGDAGKPSYALLSGNDHQAFLLGAETGVVEVWNAARLRDQPEHLNVSVTDGVFTAYAALVVHLLPVNNDSTAFKVITDLTGGTSTGCYFLLKSFIPFFVFVLIPRSSSSSPPSEIQVRERRP